MDEYVPTRSIGVRNYNLTACRYFFRFLSVLENYYSQKNLKKMVLREDCILELILWLGVQLPPNQEVPTRNIGMRYDEQKRFQISNPETLTGFLGIKINLTDLLRVV